MQPSADNGDGVPSMSLSIPVEFPLYPQFSAEFSVGRQLGIRRFIASNDDHRCCIGHSADLPRPNSRGRSGWKAYRDLPSYADEPHPGWGRSAPAAVVHSERDFIWGPGLRPFVVSR